jgi:hypothetical protein
MPLMSKILLLHHSFVEVVVLRYSLLVTAFKK